MNILTNYKYHLEGLDCLACAKKIEDKIASTSGYDQVTVNFSTCKLSFQTSKTEGVQEEITHLVQSLEPDVQVREAKRKKELGAKIDSKEDSKEVVNGKFDSKEVSKKSEKQERSGKDIARLLLGVLLYGISYFIQEQGGNIVFSSVLLMISLFVLLFRIAKKAGAQLIRNKTLDENALITISAIGACLVGKQTEGIMVIVLYEIGKILEARAVSKTRKSILELMDIKPEFAHVKKGNEVITIPPEEVHIGDEIIIKTGEKIPLDGKVLQGEAQIDQSALTGESAIKQVTKGDEVLSGAINVEGMFEMQVQKTYENSTVSQILNLVENATDKKARTETFVAKAAKIYTPTVISLAVLVAIFLPLLYAGVTYQESIYKALIFLVISCPCSIAISVPLSYFTGIGKASRRGILVKGSDYLDGIREIGEILFDKTGTITTGNFAVEKVHSFESSLSEEEVLQYLVRGESFSNHPIAKSILTYYGKEIELKGINEFREIAGKGLQYEYEGKQVKIGNASFVQLSQDLAKEQVREGKTTLYLEINTKLVGSIVLTDEIKPDAKQTMQNLSKLGIKTKMITGDKQEVADRIAKQVGIGEVKAEMLPQDKYQELEKEMKKRENKQSTRKIAYVGDGINDSPVLARSDIGISMGGIGSSSAIEASDVVIMTDELAKIPEAISISKKTNTIIKQNLIFSVGVKLVILLLSLFGIADMWEAVFADVGTTLITIINTARILK